MPFVESFAPVIGNNPKVLILGSMPGIASLEAQQYYAHPRNAFWPVMAEILREQWADDYARRIEQLKRHPVALWDTLRGCNREGSLDSAIKSNELVANDIIGLLEEHPSLRLIAFNGAASEKYFKQTVAKYLPDERALERIRLPSTSPAHASKNWQQKLHDWRAIEAYLN
jgi:hypoxanthine-DNA glycosylase